MEGWSESVDSGLIVLVTTAQSGHGPFCSLAVFFSRVFRICAMSMQQEAGRQGDTRKDYSICQQCSNQVNKPKGLKVIAYGDPCREVNLKTAQVAL